MEDAARSRRSRGELEALVLRTLWDNDSPMTAKELQAALPGARPAHTTVLTALERLRAKGQIRRVGEERRGVRFAATRTEEEYIGLAMLDRLDHAQRRSAALLHFAGQLSDEDVAALRKALEDQGDG
ncbi:BlaI/MecI/CopY family transcriptional regulator [Aeromicrobium sp. PE09-221]|uniref:BlaI/MecI/CopY family transcriptional regulator n=1 Tax=Aeromicrobium sp. PE09-221 TaxID=1898043 RepID=UPI001482388A|nr:BlaI/MecI/CopY family transcriptional regulator [Aeromicrobium sp. PE09-221]